MAKKLDKKKNVDEKASCADSQCPFHGVLSTRGRTFEGYVIEKFPRRVTIEFERTFYIGKYERYAKKKTRIHVRLPSCMEDEIQLGDYIKVKECRPLSKLIHFVVIEKIRSAKGETKK
ncbi:MAG: 30S ribosomal protein S17 [archaeon]